MILTIEVSPSPSKPVEEVVRFSPSGSTQGSDNVLLASPKRSSQRFIESVQSTEFTSSGAELRKRLPIPPPAVGSTEAMASKAKEQFLPFLSSTYGKPFRQTIQATTSSLIPNVRLQLDAIKGMTNFPCLCVTSVDSFKALGLLACASLSEDEYGIVQKNIVRILESFCTTLDILQRYSGNPPIHWTDVESRHSANPKLREPEQLIAELKHAIHNIDEAFRSYDLIPNNLRNKLPAM